MADESENSIVNLYDFIDTSKFDPNPFIYPPDKDIETLYNGTSGDMNESCKTYIKNCISNLTESWNHNNVISASDLLQMFIISDRALVLFRDAVKSMAVNGANTVNDEIARGPIAERPEIENDGMDVEEYKAQVDQYYPANVQFRDAIAETYLENKTKINELQTSITNNTVRDLDAFVSQCAEIGLIYDTPESKEKLTARLSDLSRFQDINREVLTYANDMVTSLLRWKAYANSEDPDSVVNPFVMPDETNSNSGKQNNIPENGTNTVISKEIYMNHQTSSPEYTALKESCNKAIDQFIKLHPEEVVVTSTEDGKTQITLFYSKTRDAKMKEIANRVMNTLNDDDFVIGTIPVKIILADSCIIKFEGETTAVNAAIKGLSGKDATTYANLIQRSGNGVVVDTGAVTTAVGTALDTFALDKYKFTDSIYASAGMEFHNVGNNARICVNVTMLNKFIKKWEAVAAEKQRLEDEGQATSGGTDIIPDLAPFKALYTVVSTLLRVNAEDKVRNTYNALIDAIAKTNAAKYGTVTVERVAPEAVVICAERAVVHPLPEEFEKVDTDSVTAPEAGVEYFVKTSDGRFTSAGTGGDTLKAWAPLTEYYTRKAVADSAPGEDEEEDSGDSDPGAGDASQTTTPTASYTIVDQDSVPTPEDGVEYFTKSTGDNGDVYSSAGTGGADGLAAWAPDTEYYTKD